MEELTKMSKIGDMHLYSWGFSKYGQTGIDNCQYTDEPNMLFVPLIKDVESISNGEFNSSFIFSDNKSYIFGLNTFGQLGNGTHKVKSKKLTIVPLLIPEIKLKQLSLGGGHALGLSTDNQLYSWGLNIFGQLGLGHNNNIDHPTLVEKLAYFDPKDNESLSNLKEINIQNNQTVVDIKAGSQHSLILLSDNSIYSCGFAKYGALGYFFDYANDLNNNSNMPSENNLFTKINLEKHFDCQNEKITKIAAGFAHSGCVIDNKYILIWGVNKEIKINGFNKFNISDLLKTEEEVIIKDFQIGKDFAVILTSSGAVLTEGVNLLGQLGKIVDEEENINNEIFSQVKINEKIKNISVGYDFVYVKSESKKIYAWGSNKFGQIPEYKKNICKEPFYLEKISNLKPKLISCGGYHVTALCNNETNLNETVKFFKNIPLNKCFNLDDFRQRQIYYDKVTETAEYEEKKFNSLEEEEAQYKKELKEYEKKEKLKKMREKGEKYTTEDYENVEIEKLLDEEITIDELVFPEKSDIGYGAFGDVKKAYWRKTLVCVKFLKKDFEKKENQVIPFIEEFNLLKQLRHPNILLYIGGSISGEQHFLITEYCQNGNLFELLHNPKSPELDNLEKVNLALEIAQGVNYLHSFVPPIVHRDLKSLNILLDKNYTAKICDFGWARLRNEHMTKLRGTFQWMAPEVIAKDEYSEKADVYSFGIILWEFWSRDPPYKGVKAKEVAVKVKNYKDYRPKITKDTPPEMAELMKKCWDADPNKRPTFAQILVVLDDYIRDNF